MGWLKILLFSFFKFQRLYSKIYEKTKKKIKKSCDYGILERRHIK